MTTHYCERCEAFTREPCTATWHTLTSSESDADLMGALLAALEDDESGFYVWTPGVPLLMTNARCEADHADGGVCLASLPPTGPCHDTHLHAV